MSSLIRHPNQLPIRRRRTLVVWLFSLVLLAAGSNRITAGAPTLVSPAPTVGMEGRVEVLLPGTPLTAKPVSERSNVIVRVAGTRPHGTLTGYDLRYVGLEPGSYDLRDYLVRLDASSVTNLPAIPVKVEPLLPEKHSGQLVALETKPLPRLGGYERLIRGLIIAWALLLLPFWLCRRRRKTGPAVAASARTVSLAEHLRPLVERAAQGQLSSGEQAELERLLLIHWRKRLGLDKEAPEEAARQLRAHPEAGSLLRELENWLHRPPGSVVVDVNAILAPYRNLPTEG
jgi:hypothetical protein